jgi:DNA-binding response OmpR family regulator
VARILLIDDDAGVLTSYQIVLTEAGHEVVLAEDGRAGLKLAKHNEFDLIISDLLMPEMDGLEMIRELRKERPTAKILAVSGGGNVKPGFYLKLADKFGADLTLQKPLSKSELLQAVSTLLSQPR